MKKLIQSLLNKVGYKLVPNADPFNFPVEMTKEERALVELAGQYSMTGPLRMWALVQSIRHVATKDLEGDFVECGVWRGGNLVLMKKMQEACGLDREIYAFDTFEGMSEPTEIDVDFAGKSVDKMMKSQPKKETINNIHAYCEIDTVKKNLASCGVNDGIRFIKGKVQDTLPDEKNLPEKISILRLDTDWYESTKAEMEILYPRLVKGGVLIVDDYGHYKGAQVAVDEYFGDAKPWLHFVDYTCRLAIKS